jgi:hypothetical protein
VTDETRRYRIAYLNRAYNTGHVILERSGDVLLTSDGYVAIPVAEGDPVFDSRKRFPFFPKDGEAIVYGKSYKEPTKTTTGRILTPWKKLQYSSAFELRPSKWLYETTTDRLNVARCFRYDVTEKCIFVARDFTNLMGITTEELTEHHWGWSGDEMAPIYAFNRLTHDVVFVTMPLHGKKFAEQVPGHEPEGATP